MPDNTSEQKIQNYPFLMEVALLMAYDNGMVGYHQSEEKYLETVNEVIGDSAWYDADLRVWNDWIGTLTDAQREIIAGSAEETEMEALLSEAPEPVTETVDPEYTLSNLLVAIFEY